MAWTDVGIIGSAQNKTAANNIALATTIELLVGDVVTVQLATDNSSTATGATSTHTGVSLAGNTFTKIGEITNSGGAAAGGVTLSAWRCVITTAVAVGANLTASLSFSPAAKAISARCWRADPGSTFTYSIVATNSASGAPVALTLIGLDATKQSLVIRCAAIESTSTSISTPTTGWTLGIDLGTSGGSATTNISTRAEYIITSVSSITSQPGGTSGDGSSLLFAITEIAPVVYKTYKGSKTRAQVYKGAKATDSLFYKGTDAGVFSS